MKKLILFIFVLSTVSVKAQHYVQGVPVDTVIYTGAYSFPGNSCPSMTFPKITLDHTLYNYVNGLEFMILVDSVTFGPPPQFSPVHAGDTFLLNAATPSYYTPASIVFNFRLKLVGTPTTAGQNFPCSLDFRQCACNCYQMDIMPSITNTTVCTVDLAQQLSEIITQPSLILYPNPAGNQLSVSGISQQTTIKLYNAFGALAMEQKTERDMTIGTGSLPQGIYTVYTSVGSRNSNTCKKIVISR